jgi:hypothetical protein
MPKRYIPTLILFISTIVGTIYASYLESDYISDFKVAAGIVTDLGSKSKHTVTVNGKTKSKNTQAIVSFTVEGKSYESRGRSLGYPYWEIGQKVKAFYSPNNPDISRIDRLDELYFFTILGCFFTLAFIFLVLINYTVYKVRGKPLS